mgnify:CR=1 FL=1
MRYIRSPIGKFLFDGFGFGYFAVAADGQVFRAFAVRPAVEAMVRYMVADHQKGDGYLYRARPWGNRKIARIEIDVQIED